MNTLTKSFVALGCTLALSACDPAVGSDPHGALTEQQVLQQAADAAVRNATEAVSEAE